MSVRTPPVSVKVPDKVITLAAFASFNVKLPFIVMLLATVNGSPACAALASLIVVVFVPPALTIVIGREIVPVF